ncbi:MAG: hypothetical protein PVF04_02815, partial [Anaerolineae bacterium]
MLSPFPAPQAFSMGREISGASAIGGDVGERGVAHKAGGRRAEQAVSGVCAGLLDDRPDSD